MAFQEFEFSIIFEQVIFFMITSTLVTTNALTITLPNSVAPKIKKQTVSISITEDLRYFINNEAVEKTFIENKIKEVIKSDDDLTIVLRAAKTIPMQYAVEILDLAYRNNYKIVIATQPN